MKKPPESLVARAQLYKLLSTGFLYPDQRLLASLTDGSFIQSLKNAVKHLPESYDLTSEVAAIHKAIHGAQQPIAADFEHEYTRLFSQSNTVATALYETEYAAEHIFAKTRELADIAGFYAAFGLTPSDQLRERPDHAGSELEFMYVLLIKEAYALLNNWSEKAEICRDAERRFLTDHLGKWVPSLCRHLRETASLSYYRSLAAMVARFILADCQTLNVNIDIREDLLPKVTQYEDFTCPMQTCAAKQSEEGLRFE